MSDEETLSVLTLLQAIQSGQMTAETMTAEDRRSCVEQLTIDAYSVLEIAQLLKVSDRTVRRDREHIRRSHAVDQDPEFVGNMVGQLVQQAEQAIERLVRAGRRAVQIHEKVNVEVACWRIRKELVESLQRLGHLPTADLKIRSDVTHHVGGDLPATADLRLELARLETLEIECGADEMAVARIRRLKLELERVYVAEEIQEIENKTTMKECTNEEQTKRQLGSEAADSGANVDRTS